MSRLERTDSIHRFILYLICGVTDFAAFVVVFVVSRGLAESHASPTWLGIVGGGLAFCQGVGSVLGGWLSHRHDDRAVFLVGVALTLAGIAACGAVAPPVPESHAAAWLVRHALEWLPRLMPYWVVGIALGLLYPPLIGWLNQGRDARTARGGVSRTLILFCVSWNLGMMAGQLTAGSLFAHGRSTALAVALGLAVLNLWLAIWIVATRHRVATACLPDDAPVAPVAPPRVASVFKRLSWQANLAGMFGGSMVIHLLPDLAVKIGVAPESHGTVLALWRVVIIGTYFAMHFFPFWHFRLSTALASQALAAGGLVVISQATSVVSLMVGLAMLGQLVGYNYFAGLFYSAAGSSQTGRALAAGLHEATLAAGMAVGTIVGGILGTEFDFRFPYLLAAGVAVVLMGVQLVAYLCWAPHAAALEPSEATP